MWEKVKVIWKIPELRTKIGLTLLRHSKVLDHASDGLTNLISIVGVKYTTARAVAEQVIDLVLRKLGRLPAACRTAETRLPTAGEDDAPPENPVRHAVDVEMAQTLADVVVRRTSVGAAGYPGDGLVYEYASAMQAINGWSIERLSSEIASLKRFYELQ